MTDPITPKTAYVSLEQALSVDNFRAMWDEVGEELEPTQKDYDNFCLTHGKAFFYEMRGDIEESIRLKEVIKE